MHHTQEIHTSRLNGLLVIDKPLEMSSKDISRQLSRFLGGKQKMGHIGTLDPMATGMLLVALGKATRLESFLIKAPKRYCFEIQLGYETDTLDLDKNAKLVSRLAWQPFSKETLEKVLADFRGEIIQEPPLYSAIKYKGKALYHYARQGLADQIDLSQFKKEYTVYELELKDFDSQKGTISCSVQASKGFYIRSLARDIARALGSCGTVSKLRRIECSGFKEKSMHSLAEIEESFHKENSLDRYLIRMEEIPLKLERICLEKEELVRRVQQGQIIYLEQFKSRKKIDYDLDKQVILLQEDGKVLGLGKKVPCQNKQGQLGFKLLRSLV